MSVITNLLDVYSDRLSQAECLEAQIKQASPDLWVAREQALKEAEQVKAEIKEKSKRIGPSVAHTLVGKFHQLVWKPGRKVLSPDKIQALIDLNELEITLDDLKEEQPGWWEARKRGK